jgi:NitT/TauT family transport system substrate-binding protein
MKHVPGWLVGALLVGLLACAPATPAPSSRETPANDHAPAAPVSNVPAAAESPPSTPVRRIEVALGALTGGNAPIWVAADYGLFHQYGLEVEVIPMAPATVGQALSAGNVPLAVSGGGSVSAWVGGAKDLVFIAGLTNKAIHKLVARPEITSVDDLRGKLIGNTTAGSTGDVALRAALRHFGLEPDRHVEMSYFRDQPGMVGALLSGSVQAAILSSPYSEQALGAGMRQLADLRDLNVEILSFGIISTRRELEQDREMLCRFLMGYIDGIRYAREHPSEAVESIVRGTRNPDRAAAEVAYDLYRDLWTPWISEAAIQLLINNLDVPEAKTTRAADMVDDRLVRELAASGWLAEHLGPR